MDAVTKSFVKQYLDSFEIKGKSDALDFEKYSSYTLLKKEYGSDLEINIDDIVTNDSSKGLDGIAIIINEKIIATSVQDIDDIVDATKTFSIDYVFVQAKVETSFSGTAIQNLTRTIKDFFSDNPHFVMTDKVQKAYDLKKYLEFKYAQTSRNPNLKIFYSTLGKWTNDANLSGELTISIKELNDLNYFNDVRFEPIDKQKIQNYDRKIRESISASFSFEKQFDLPLIEGVDKAYYGIVNYNEFKSLIIDDGDKIKNVFYDNVRDFLGENDVNLKISSTLTEKQFDKFLILNNGVTVVADEKKDLQGSKFTIFNYQIVNGCQTSHVLYNTKAIEGIENVKIPLRLIITKNDDIKSKITLATNSQSAITEEQLAAFSDFQKNLEQYYKSVEINEIKLYYERRTGQYNADISIKKSRIITIKNQIKAVASMFFNKPHLVSGYYGKVYKNVEKEIFKKDDKLEVYFLSSYALFKLEQLIQKDKTIDAKYNKVRYHMLMIFRIITAGFDLPKYFNSSDMEKYCEKIRLVLNNDSKTLKTFEKVCNILDGSSVDLNNQKLMYQENTRNKFLDSALKLLISDVTNKPANRKR